MTASQRLTLTRADARRLLVCYHFRPAPLATVIRRLGTIQFDPLAPVGTNPDLVLQARVPGYRQGDWQEAAYGQRLLVDGWDKQASLIQPAEWWAQAPFHRWFARRWRRRGVDIDAPEARAQVEQVERHGPSTEPIGDRPPISQIGDRPPISQMRACPSQTARFPLGWAKHWDKDCR